MKRWNNIVRALGTALVLFSGSVFGYYEGIKLCARAEGMGEAFLAIADDANAIYYNPAGLGLLDKFQIPTCYYRPFTGLDLGGFSNTFFAVAGPVPNFTHLGTFGFGWYRSSASFVANLDADNATKEYDMNSENILYL